MNSTVVSRFAVLVPVPGRITSTELSSGGVLLDPRKNYDPKRKRAWLYEYAPERPGPKPKKKEKTEKK